MKIKFQVSNSIFESISNALKIIYQLFKLQLTFSVSFSGDQRSDNLRFSVVKLENKSQNFGFSSQTSPLKIHCVVCRLLYSTIFFLLFNAFRFVCRFIISIFIRRMDFVWFSIFILLFSNFVK